METTKYCKRCDRTLPIENFSKDKKLKDGYAFYCKDCASDYGRIYRKTSRGIYHLLKARAGHYDPYEIDMSLNDFLEWEQKTPRVCVYCDIPERDIWILNKHLGSKAKRLTIDCIKPNFYHIDNIVWACDRCNVIKGHQFTFNEMREIGQRYVKPYWQKIKEETKK